MAIEIAIDIGHGKETFPPDKGVYSSGKPYSEHYFNSKVAVELEKLLKLNGFKTVMYQKPFSNEVSLTKRTNYYNSCGVDLVWSIHANANSNTAVSGRCAFYWHTSSKGKKLANLFAAEMKKAGYNTHGNGTHASMRDSWTDLHICRETKMVAVLTENGFMTNPKDFDLIFGSKQNQYVKDVAVVHAKAICEYFGVTFKDGPVSAANAKKTTTYSNKQVEVIYSGSDGLNFYDKPDFNAKPFNAFKKGEKRYLMAKYLVGNSSMYQFLGRDLKTYYITAHSKYVKVIDAPGIDLSSDDRIGEAVIKNQKLNYRRMPSLDAPIIRQLPAGYGSKKDEPLHIYEIQGHWLRLGVGWVSNKDGAYVNIGMYKDKPKGHIYRVIIDGKQVGAYAEDSSILTYVQEAVENGKNNVVVEKV